MKCLYCNRFLNKITSEEYYECPRMNCLTAINHTNLLKTPREIINISSGIFVNNKQYFVRNSKYGDFFVIYQQLDDIIQQYGNDDKLILRTPFQNTSSLNEIFTITQRYLNLKSFL